MLRAQICVQQRQSLLLFLMMIYYLPNAFCKKPNIVFIVVDDLKPWLGCYGVKNAYTPNIDKFSSGSFLFLNAFAQQALCAPSRNSFLTSRRPDSLHLYDFYSYWRTAVGNFTTLPQHFKENGYFTKSLGKVFHPGISSNSTDDAKYSWSDVPFHPKTEKYKNAKVCPNLDGSLGSNLLCPVIVSAQPGGTLPDIETKEASIRFLRNWQNTTGGRPFLLAVGFHKPHIPMKFPIIYLNYHPIENVTLPENRWRPSSLPLVAWNPWNDIRKRNDVKRLNISFPFGPMPDNYMKRIIQHYNAAVTYVDNLIGEVLKYIDDTTIVVITGDHGWSSGEHGEFSKYSNYEVATRVPLVIRVSGLNKKNTIIKDHVELVDLFPTLVDLSQVSASLETCPANKNSTLCTEGKSLIPLMVDSLKGKVHKNRNYAFSQYPRPGIYPMKYPDSDRPRLKQIKIMGYSISTKQYRYTEWVRFHHDRFKADWNKSYGKELYDHLIDPEENLNLFDRPELKNISHRLRKKLILKCGHHT